MIRNEGDSSRCVTVQRRRRRRNAGLEEYDPYEVPISLVAELATSNTATSQADKEVDSMTLQMQEAHEGPTGQLLSHSSVKLRDSCMITNDTKILNVSLLAGDDQELVLALWNDANEDDEES